MKEILLVFLGSGAGGSLRFLVGKWSSAFWTSAFPLATFCINISAAFLIGLFIGMAGIREQQVRLLLVTGFCGGFSTFSAFSYESVQLYEQQAYFSLGIYIVFSVILCILATIAGLAVAR